VRALAPNMTVGVSGRRHAKPETLHAIKANAEANSM